MIIEVSGCQKKKTFDGNEYRCQKNTHQNWQKFKNVNILQLVFQQVNIKNLIYLWIFLNEDKKKNSQA